MKNTTKVLVVMFLILLSQQAFSQDATVIDNKSIVYTTAKSTGSLITYGTLKYGMTSEGGYNDRFALKLMPESKGIAGTSDSDFTVTKKKSKYYQDGKRLTNKQLKNLLLSNTESEKLYHTAKTYQTVGIVISITGAAVIGLAEGLAIGRNNVNASEGKITNPPSYVGYDIAIVVVELVSVPFYISADHQMKKSVAKYNSNGITNNRNDIKMNMCFNIYPGKVGLVANF